MSGLLLKEFLYIKKLGKTLILGLIIATVFFAAAGGSRPDAVLTFLIALAVMLSILMTTNTMAFDETAKWDGYVKSLPVSTEQIVGAKYLLSAILSAAGLVAAFVVELVIKKGRLDSGTVATICVGAGATPMVFCSILLPLYYKFGLQKSRIVLMLLFLVPIAVAMALSSAGMTLSDGQFFILLKLSPVILLAVIAASFFLSCRIYRNKDI